MSGAPVQPAQHGTCLNCETALAGPFCHACGQHRLHAPRSLPELAAEFLEMMTHADGKLWRTLRRLFLSPARLTRDYVEGRRASEIPPVRMFFVSLLVAFTLSSFASPVVNRISGRHDTSALVNLAGHEDDLEKGARALNWPGHPRITAWTHAHLDAAIHDPREVEHVMFEWAERIVLLLLPITACTLWLLHAFPRPVPLFDHAILTLHSLTTVSIAMTVTRLLHLAFPEGMDGLVTLVLIIGLCVHLYAHMRGFYRAGRIATLLRMVLLGAISLVACSALLGVLALIGLQLGAGPE